MKNPYLNSGKRHSDITTAEWPVVTRELLRDFSRLESTHTPEQINQPLFALIRARKAINDAILECHRARRLHGENKLLSERLSEISEQLKTEHDRFPVTLFN